MNPSLAAVHVLVVDDSPAIRGLLTELLQGAGATVTATDTAERALALLEQSRPDVLLSDLEMPGKDGDWLIRQVRALPRDRGGLTPAACLTGRSSPEDQAHVLEAGFQHHIAKPVDMRRLLAIVGSLAFDYGAPPKQFLTLEV